MSTDGGNWKFANANTKNISGPLANDTKFLYSGGPSIWKRSLGEFNINIVSDTRPDQSLSIFPNPANDVLHISSTLPVGTAYLYDQKGTEVKKEHFSGMENFSLSLTGLCSGVYYLRIVDNAGNESANAHFVVQRTN